LHVLEELVSSSERRKQLLTWAFIIGGALLLAISIFRLSSVAVPTEQQKPELVPSQNQQQLEEVNKQLEAERDARMVIDRQLATARKELQEAQAQRDAAVRSENRNPTPNAPAPRRGPIDWYTDSQLFVVSGGAPNAEVNGILIMGLSSSPVTIKEAYVVSGLTGRKQTLMANVQSRGAYFPVDQVDIPSGAPVQVDAIFKPAIPLKDFLDQWGKFRVTIVYNDGTIYEREYEESYVRQKLQQMAPTAFGPRMTPRDDK
jgi:hypothetical protein